MPNTRNAPSSTQQRVDRVDDRVLGLIDQIRRHHGHDRSGRGRIREGFLDREQAAREIERDDRHRQHGEPEQLAEQQISAELAPFGVSQATSEARNFLCERKARSRINQGTHVKFSSGGVAPLAFLGAPIEVGAGTASFCFRISSSDIKLKSKSLYMRGFC